MSYRKRGKDPRIQRKIKNISILIKTLNTPIKKTNPVNILKKIIELYSPIKIIEKRPAPYSVLKPETNSDSPSEKSKGERLHSAIHDITQQKSIPPLNK